MITTAKYSHPVAIKVRRASNEDAEALSVFAATTFRETFKEENAPEDMSGYLAKAFTPQRQRDEIADSSGVVLVAEDLDGSAHRTLVGYAHLVADATPEAVKGPEPIELKRLYVSSQWHGRGVGQALMEAALDAARARGAETMWLGVWERNPRAVAFYAKYRFERVGMHTFQLGSDMQTDWLFSRPVSTTVDLP